MRIIAFSAEFHIADAGKAVEIADRVARAVGAVGADLDGTRGIPPDSACRAVRPFQTDTEKMRDPGYRKEMGSHVSEDKSPAEPDQKFVS